MLGQYAYNLYKSASGGKSLVSGAELPKWGYLDPQIQEAWRAVESQVRKTERIVVTEEYHGEVWPFRVWFRIVLFFLCPWALAWQEWRLRKRVEVRVRDLRADLANTRERLFKK